MSHGKKVAKSLSGLDAGKDIVRKYYLKVRSKSINLTFLYLKIMMMMISGLDAGMDKVRKVSKKYKEKVFISN